MKKEFSRIKSNATEPAYVDTSEVPFIDALVEIIKCELGWGAKCEVFKDHITFSVMVFGDRDTTTFSGTEQELDFIERMCIAYKRSELRSLQDFFFNEMNIPLKEERYLTNEILELYAMSVSGTPIEELIDLASIMTPHNVPPPSKKPTIVGSATLDLYKQLDDGDSAKTIIASAILQSEFGVLP